jgi:hypothetical protein
MVATVTYMVSAAQALIQIKPCTAGAKNLRFEKLCKTPKSI